jgi:HNH endonuclease
LAHERIMTVTILNGLGHRAKVFSPVGFCIYCGAKGDLGEEHIIPFGLGGNLILPDASCSQCSDITGAQVEGAILNAYWGTHGVPRPRLNLPTRKPKKRPKKRILTITDRTGQSRTVAVAAGEIPLAFIGMTTALPEPGVLWNAPTTDQFHGEIWIKYNEQELRKFAGPGESVQGIGKFNPLTYGRMICKVAHALAFAEHGVSFIPLLQDVILGKSAHITHYLSGRVSPEQDMTGLHSLQIGWLERKATYLIAYVRLFCNYGTPLYMVTVGQRRDDVTAPL